MNAPFIRLVFGPSVAGGGPREVAVDCGEHTSFGRGAYVHADPACLRAAVQRGLAKAAKSAVWLGGQPLTEKRLAEEIVRAYEHRTASLLIAARRAHRLEVGTEAARGALARDAFTRGDEPKRAPARVLAIVATDAAAAADLSEVRRAVAEGNAIAFGTKASLGSLFTEKSPRDKTEGDSQHPGFAIAVVTDSRFARAVRESHWIASSVGQFVKEERARVAPAPKFDGRKSEKRGSSEPGSILVEGAATLRASAESGLRRVSAPDVVE